MTLCSRRALNTRHFDVKPTWFDRRHAYRHHFEFFEQSLELRLKHIREARGGGSVPPMYMQELREAEADGRLELKCVDAKVESISADCVHVLLGSELRHFDLIVNACGHVPDCRRLPLVAQLLEDHPLDVIGGFPAISQDLRWGDFKNLFVIGALASLQVGPDAGNLMGLRRAGHIMANVLGLREWLKDTGSILGNIRGNRYAALGDSDESSDAESDGSECSECSDSGMADAEAKLDVRSDEVSTEVSMADEASDHTNLHSSAE